MRNCNGCTMCCTELSQVTPAHVACDHQCASGCQIYEDRPEGCATFECGWLQGVVDEQYKPDVVGWMLDMRTSKTPSGELRVGFALGPKRDGQRDAVKSGLVIVSQDGQLHAANEDDKRAYTSVSDMIARLRRSLRRSRQKERVT